MNLPYILTHFKLFSWIILAPWGKTFCEIHLLATKENQESAAISFSHTTQHLKGTFSRDFTNQSTHKTGTQQSAQVVWSDSHVMLACNSDDLMGAAVVVWIEGTPVQATRGSDDFTGLVVLHTTILLFLHLACHFCILFKHSYLSLMILCADLF